MSRTKKELTDWSIQQTRRGLVVKLWPESERQVEDNLQDSSGSRVDKFGSNCGAESPGLNRVSVGFVNRETL